MRRRKFAAIDIEVTESGAKTFRFSKEYIADLQRLIALHLKETSNSANTSPNSYFYLFEDLKESGFITKRELKLNFLRDLCNKKIVEKSRSVELIIGLKNFLYQKLSEKGVAFEVSLDNDLHDFIVDIRQTIETCEPSKFKYLDKKFKSAYATFSKLRASDVYKTKLDVLYFNYSRLKDGRLKDYSQLLKYRKIFKENNAEIDYLNVTKDLVDYLREPKNLKEYQYARETFEDVIAYFDTRNSKRDYFLYLYWSSAYVYFLHSNFEPDTACKFNELSFAKAVKLLDKIALGISAQYIQIIFLNDHMIVSQYHLLPSAIDACIAELVAKQQLHDDVCVADSFLKKVDRLFELADFKNPKCDEYLTIAKRLYQARRCHIHLLRCALIESKLLFKKRRKKEAHKLWDDFVSKRTGTAAVKKVLVKSKQIMSRDQDIYKLRKIRNAFTNKGLKKAYLNLTFEMGNEFWAFFSENDKNEIM